MRMTENKFKAALRSGQIQYGLWLGLADTYSAEICAGAGFDWLLIDAEHGPNELRSILAQQQSIAAYASQPVVRPPQGDAVLIKQLLETGIQTVLVPMVDSAAQAKELVRAMRYPPQGMRGVGSVLARASRWGRIEDYLERANDEVCLLVQVETTTGLENLSEIPLSQNCCRLVRITNPGAIVEERSGEIRTSLQGQSSSAVVAA